MTEFFQNRMDYVYFVYGLTFFLLAAVTYALMAAGEKRLPWHWLTCFGLAFGTHEWMAIVEPAIGAHLPGTALRLTFMAVAFLCLMEFAREGTAAVAGQRPPGWWILVACAALAGLAGFWGPAAMSASVRCFVGLPAGLWSAWVFWRAGGSRPESRGAGGLRAAGALMLLFALAGGLVVPAADVLTVSLIEYGAFLDAVGLPIQLVRCVLIGCLALVLRQQHYLWQKRMLTSTAVRRELQFDAVSWIGLTAILAGGWFVVEAAGESARAGQRREMERLVRSLAATVEAADVAELSGAPGDARSQAHRRLQDRVRRMCNANGDICHLYLVAWKDRRPVFLVDTEPDWEAGKADQPNALPGDVYEDAPAGIKEAVRLGRPAMVGPYRDKWGTFVTVVAPIRHPLTGRHVASLAMDVNASRWLEKIAQARLSALVTTALVIGLTVVFVVLWRTVRESGEALRKAYLELEDRVRERTAELSRANEELRREIRERQRAEEERRRIEEKMIQTQKMESLGLMAGSIAHDLNNILMVILGNVDLIRAEAELNNAALSCLKDVEKAARRAAGISAQMLAYSGKGQLSVQTVNLCEVLMDMMVMLESLVSKNAYLRGDYAADIPLVEVDLTQIQQVVTNLVINASDALEDREGAITLRVHSMECDKAYLANTWLTTDLPAGRYVAMEVTDDGCGMTPDALLRIFDPFYTTKFFGRGLGLPAVLGIVRGHRGTIEVRSEPGRGTLFRVLLPAVQGGAANAGPPKRPAGLWRGHGTVLLVDDDDTVRALGAKMLERMGFRALTASDGFEAGRIFEQQSDEITCVLLDLTMPQMDGQETLLELRRIRGNVRVLLCSGYTEEEMIRRFQDGPPAGYIQKPYSLDELSERLRQVLGKSVS